MKSNFDAELQLHSATETDPDPMDTRIRELTAALAEDVPPDLNKNVMKAIRAERKRDAFRRRFIRLGGAIAAALVIVPMAAVVVPMMIRQEKNMDDSQRAVTAAVGHDSSVCVALLLCREFYVDGGSAGVVGVDRYR